MCLTPLWLCRVSFHKAVRLDLIVQLSGVMSLIIIVKVQAAYVDAFPDLPVHLVCVRLHSVGVKLFQSWQQRDYWIDNDRLSQQQRSNGSSYSFLLTFLVPRRLIHNLVDPLKVFIPPIFQIITKYLQNEWHHTQSWPTFCLAANMLN